MKKNIIILLSILIITVVIASFAVFSFRLDPRVPTPKDEPKVVNQKQKPVAEPQTIEIPKINVKAPIESVGLDQNKKMLSPTGWDDAGWYNLGYRPGEAGSAVISGHLDRSDGSPAVFWDLKKLSTGDEIFVTDTQSIRHRFVVTDTRTYSWNEVPLQEIFDTKGNATLNLITCAGTFSQGNYSNRTVVFSKAE